MTVGENIRRFRKELGWTQAKLAEELHVTQQSIGQFENGEKPPKLETIEKIAAALGVTPFDLIGYEYYDMKYPEAGKEFKEFDGFLNYLESLGYAVDMLPAGDPEDPGATYEISGNKLSTVTLTSSEFEQLRSSSEDMIFSFLWKKQQK